MFDHVTIRVPDRAEAADADRARWASLPDPDAHTIEIVSRNAG